MASADAPGPTPGRVDPRGRIAPPSDLPPSPAEERLRPGRRREGDRHIGTDGGPDRPEPPPPPPRTPGHEPGPGRRSRPGPPSRRSVARRGVVVVSSPASRVFRPTRRGHGRYDGHVVFFVDV